MNKIIKTLTLLFFLSGIGLFVAYSSGCFTVKKELSGDETLLLVDSLVSEYKKEDIRFSSSKSMGAGQLMADLRRRRKVDSLLMLIDKQDRNLVLAHDTIIQAEIDSLENARLVRMLSSKSGVIDQTEYTAVEKRLQLLENMLKQRQ